MRRILFSTMFVLPFLSNAQNNNKNLDKLWNQIFTKSHVRSPYLPVIFDKAYKNEAKKDFNGFISNLHEKAKTRQLALEVIWKSLEKEQSAKYLILQYIFEEKPQSFLDKHIKNFSEEIKFQTAKLLISECNFKKGLGILLDLNKSLKANDPLKKKVVSFLKSYSFYEKDLHKNESLLFHDLEAFKSDLDSIEIPPVEQVVDLEFYNHNLAYSDEIQYEFREEIQYEPSDEDHPLFLFQGKHGAFLKENNAGRYWLPDENNAVTLHTLFKGEVIYQLFAVKSPENFLDLSPEKFKKLKALKEWQDKSSTYKNNHSSEYAKLKVKLPGLKEGKYILTAKLKFCPYILLKRIAVTEKVIFSNKNNSSVDVIVLNRKTLKPIAGESIRIFNKDKKTSLVKKSDKNGLISIDDIFESNKLYIKSVSNPVLLQSYISTYRYYADSIASVWTSAPLYKPGELVQFRGNIRRKGLQSSEALEKQNISVRIRDPKNRTVWSRSLTLSKLGSFHSEFKLPLSAKVAKYSFEVDGISLDGFEVKAYRLPRFKFALQNKASFQKIHTNYKNTLTLQHMNGAPMSSQKIKIFLGNGTLKPKSFQYLTDKNGQVKIDIDHSMLSKNSINTLTFEFRSPDGSINKEMHEISYFENPLLLSLNAKHFPDESYYSPSLIFNARDYVKPISVSYKLLDAQGEIIKEINSSDVEIIVKKSSKIKTIECTANYKGYSTTIRKNHKPVLQAANKLLSIHCKKSSENLDRVNINISWNPKSGKSVKAYLFGQNLRTSFRKVLTLKPGHNSLPVKMDRKWGPNIYFNLYVFTSETKDNYLERSCSVNIRSNEKINFSVSSDKKVYKPGEECSVTIKCTDSNGAPLANAELSLSVLNRHSENSGLNKCVNKIANKLFV